jgi:uncharacterized protein (TIGR03083 family)
MEVEGWVAALGSDGRLMARAAESAGLDAPVPSCPAWTVRDLLAHTGYVHRWATGYVASALTEMVEARSEQGVLDGAPSDPELAAWFSAGHAGLAEALSSAPSSLDCWTFLPAPSPRAFWARRQAHETAVHRVDAEPAAGLEPSGLDARFAVDGVDELLFGFFARARSRRLPPLEPGVIGLEATEPGTSWTDRVSPGRIETTRGRDECDVVVRGASARSLPVAVEPALTRGPGRERPPGRAR